MIQKTATRRFRQPVLVLGFCVGVLGGVAVARRWVLDGAQVLWLVLPFVFGVRRRGLVALVCLVVLGCGIGWWRGSMYMQRLSLYDSVLGQKVTLVGTATTDAVYGSREQLTFDMAQVQVVASARGSPGINTTPLVGTLSVAGFGAPMVYRGDRVQATGKLLPTLGDNQASISFAALQVVQTNHSSLVDALRRKFVAGMQTALPEPLASFGLGLLIGQRNTLPANVSQQLLMVGLTHIIAVSGYNLTIMLQVARRLLAKCSKFQMTAACVGLMLLFLALAGSSPSLVRAALVSTLSLAAWYYGREIKPAVLIFASAAMTALANPLYLWGNVSWYLSFLAFFGVVVIGPMLTRRLFGAREPPLIIAVLVESLCAEMMTAPYVLYIFGQVSLVALPANLLVVALVPLAMLLSLVAGLAGMVAAVFAGWFAWPARLLLGYMLDVSNLLAHAPHAFIQNLAFSLAMLLSSYAAIGFAAAILHSKNRSKPGIITASNEATVEGVTA